MPNAPRADLNVAIHLHLENSDYALAYLMDIERAKGRIDIFVTTNSLVSELEIRYIFREYSRGSIQVSTVSRQGRNISPLLAQLAGPVHSRSYDLVGHFHGNVCLALDGSSTPDAWRDFSTAVLLGDPDNLSKIASLFESNAQLGMVFAEENHCIGWRDSLVAAEAVNEVFPNISVPTFPIFPIGSMFWFRPEALKQLWNHPLFGASLPDEPLRPYGTALDAVERLLPSFCDASRYEWCTVYRRGISR